MFSVKPSTKSVSSRFEVLTAVLLKILDFRDVALCRWVRSSGRFGGIVVPYNSEPSSRTTRHHTPEYFNLEGQQFGLRMQCRAMLWEVIVAHFNLLSRNLYGE
jgi:hypothetical protein